MGVSDEARLREREKYQHVYAALATYKMGAARMQDAIADLRWAFFDHNCTSMLDVGCGRGEMLGHAELLGFIEVRGAETVPDLCDDHRVIEMPVHRLHEMPEHGFDLVTSFDVLEHLLPGDDELLLLEMGRIASRCVAMTANNRPSVDPTTGADLHINKRPYDQWDRLIRDLLEPDWHVERCAGKQYVSETWRAWR